MAQGYTPRDSWLAVLDRYRVQFLILDKERDSTLLSLVRSQPGWAVDFEDEVSVLFNRSPAGGIRAVSKSSWISRLNFRGLALFLRLRERSGSPQKQIEALGLRPGQVVLDYGCGIGSYSLPAARALGEDGTVYALDIHPLAVEMVERRIKQENLSNVRTILSGLETGLPDESVDIVLLYDVLHHVHDKGALVRELHRVLKADGLLSVIPDHMQESEFLKVVQSGRRFLLQRRHTDSFEFAKQTNGKKAPVTGG